MYIIVVVKSYRKFYCYNIVYYNFCKPIQNSSFFSTFSCFCSLVPFLFFTLQFLFVCTHFPSVCLLCFCLQLLSWCYATKVMVVGYMHEFTPVFSIAVLSFSFDNVNQHDFQWRVTQLNNTESRLYLFTVVFGVWINVFILYFFDYEYF